MLDLYFLFQTINLVVANKNIIPIRYLVIGTDYLDFFSES